MAPGMLRLLWSGATLWLRSLLRRQVCCLRSSAPSPHPLPIDTQAGSRATSNITWIGTQLGCPPAPRLAPRRLQAPSRRRPPPHRPSLRARMMRSAQQQPAQWLQRPASRRQGLQLSMPANLRVWRQTPGCRRQGLQRLTFAALQLKTPASRRQGLQRLTPASPRRVRLRSRQPVQHPQRGAWPLVAGLPGVLLHAGMFPMAHCACVLDYPASHKLASSREPWLQQHQQQQGGCQAHQRGGN